MFTKVRSFLTRFHRDEKGVTLVEYGIALTLAVAVGTVALSNLSTAVSGKMNAATTAMGGTTTTTTTP